MKGAMLYVNAGKGHYMPAKALYDSMLKAGYDAVLEDLFVVFDTPFWEFFCKYDWRFLLHHPKLEPVVHKMTDNRMNFHLINWQGLMKKHSKGFLRWYEKERPDFIVSTNFLGGIFLPSVVEKYDLSVPIYQYAADVFDTPLTGVNGNIDKMFFPTQLGCENAIKKGQPDRTVSLCPFPLQEKMSDYTPLSKIQAREKLGLDKEKFTVLYSLGGEGIGNPHFVLEIAKRNLDWQVVVIGGSSKTMKRSFDRLQDRYPSFSIVRPGFVDNVQEYLSACDVQVGKAGANALMEAMYLKRPCLVSELLYAALATENFFSKHGVGWCENDVEKQIDILHEYASNPYLQKEMSRNFENLPVSFGADKFRDLLLAETERFRRHVAR